MDRSIHYILSGSGIVTGVFILLTFPTLILFQTWIINHEYKYRTDTVAPAISRAQQTDLAQQTLEVLNQASFAQVTRGLSQLEIPSTMEPLYTAAEISHLTDVFRLKELVTNTLIISLVIFGTGVVVLWHQKERRQLARTLTISGLIAIGLTVSIVLFLVLAWEQLFTMFHQLFFPQGNWAFPVDSALIRLFPETFWFHLFVYYLCLIIIASICFMSIGIMLKRKMNKELVRLDQ